jgi:hypothetical protein
MATRRSTSAGDGSVPRLNDPTSGGITMGNLNVSDLRAASWGSSWEPDVRDRREWMEIAEWPPPEGLGAASQSADEIDACSIFERFGERRLVPIGR